MRSGTTAFAVAAAILCLAPAAAMASSTPTPDVLKAALAEPPSTDYIEATVGTAGVLEGPFDAPTYAKAQTTDSSKQAQVVHQLDVASFVTGYGRAWVSAGLRNVLVEQILVFADRSGASAEYGASRLVDLSNPGYKGALDTSSIPNSYGVKDLLSTTYATGVVWAKGNDLIVVVFASSSSYLDKETLAQAQKEDALAPDYTIQPPASSHPSTQSADAVRTVAVAAIVLVLLAIVATAVLLYNRSRRGQQYAVATGAGGAQAPVSMSPDGRYWWDGRAWQDAMLSAPPNAPRSPDGAFWWDGAQWHALPRGYA